MDALARRIPAGDVVIASIEDRDAAQASMLAVRARDIVYRAAAAVGQPQNANGR